MYCRYKNTTVPYRGNRMVLFQSNLFHQTDELHFKAGYEHRRTGLVYLFGARTLEPFEDIRRAYLEQEKQEKHVDVHRCNQRDW